MSFCFVSLFPHLKLFRSVGLMFLWLEVNGNCIMYGQCFEDARQKKLNCFTPNFEPVSSKDWDEETKNNLRSVCPELFGNKEGNIVDDYCFSCGS